MASGTSWSPELETLDQLDGGDMALNVIRRVWPDDARFLVGIKALVVAGDVALIADDGTEVPAWRLRLLFDERSILNEIGRFSLRLTQQGISKLG